MNFQTDQESFWAGTFGDQYSERSTGQHLLASRTAMLADIMKRTRKIHSLIEYGPNIGLNMRAIQYLFPNIQLTAVEINKAATCELNKIEHLNVINSSLLQFTPDRQWDMVLISGVLIHINPDFLPQVYRLLYESSGKYICLSEYYNPTPVTIPYRGHDERLFKRDFAGELMDMYPDLQLVDYRFIYHRDPNFPADDPTWFLLQKITVE